MFAAAPSVLLAELVLADLLAGLIGVRSSISRTCWSCSSHPKHRVVLAGHPFGLSLLELIGVFVSEDPITAVGEVEELVPLRSQLADPVLFDRAEVLPLIVRANFQNLQDNVVVVFGDPTVDR
jgi:hypothetical protein